MVIWRSSFIVILVLVVCLLCFMVLMFCVCILCSAWRNKFMIIICCDGLLNLFPACTFQKHDIAYL